MHKKIKEAMSFAAAVVLACAALSALADTPVYLPESAVREDGPRIIHIHYPVFNAKKEVVEVIDGSGYLLDRHHAITAAHVIRQADKSKQPLIVQVGMLPGHNYLTTAHIERIDYRRDLAVLDVGTYTLSAETVVPHGPAKICTSRPAADSHYASGGVSPTSGGSVGSIEARWVPTLFGTVLDGDTLPRLPKPPTDANWTWREGDPVLILQNVAAPGDSGGAIFEADGCFAGVTSATVQINIAMAMRKE
ncbi:hypothetical protein NLI96_g13244 [Meripilus lineatus]|uniref:Serine protease n=1 Tax=Meripilus lineatus TaxID=2056292 RepID=A0AAD5UND3_9APHY|nr:hypothetical protein NLI96_g13244 [Physisporinus lineatus]